MATCTDRPQHQFINAVLFDGLVIGLGANGQPHIPKDAVGHVVDESVHGQRLPTTPGLLHNVVLTDMANLLHHVQLAQAVHAVLIGRQAIKNALVFVSNVLNMPQPVRNHAKALIVQGRLNSPAAIMTNDEDMLDLKHVNGELKYRQAIEVCG